MNWDNIGVPSETKAKVRDIADVLDEPLSAVTAEAVDAMYADVVGDPDEPRVFTEGYEEQGEAPERQQRVDTGRGGTNFKL